MYFSLHISFTFIVVGIFLIGCRSSSVHSIPDAPPPYPSFPVPQERYNTAEVYGGQTSNMPYIPPYSSSSTTNQISAPSPYAPPPSPPQNVRLIEQKPVYSYNQHRSTFAKPAVEPSAESARFLLEAKSDLWALVQNAEGVDLEFLQMKSGDTAQLHHTGPLIITCSTGDQLVIKDKNLKPIKTNPNASGFTIVRLIN